MPLIGFGEMLGGLLFIFPKTRALGALVIFPVMLGIICRNLIFESGANLAMPFIFFLINVWMIADNWKKYKPMIS